MKGVAGEDDQVRSLSVCRVHNLEHTGLFLFKVAIVQVSVCKVKDL
jgi:hypothetical protein